MHPLNTVLSTRRNETVIVKSLLASFQVIGHTVVPPATFWDQKVPLVKLVKTFLFCLLQWYSWQPFCGGTTLELIKSFIGFYRFAETSRSVNLFHHSVTPTCLGHG